MAGLEKDNCCKEDIESVSGQNATLSETSTLVGDFKAKAATEPGNVNQGNQRDRVKPKEVMDPPPQSSITQASPSNGASKGSNDGVSASLNNDGSRRALVGAAYHQKLSIPLVCQVAKLIREGKLLKFTITNENKEEGGLFDDIVFQSPHGDLFIQAKHNEGESYAITWDDLTSHASEQFAISKYLNSFLQKKWDKREKTPKLDLCTNTGLHEDVKTTVTKYTFDTKVVDSILKYITHDVYKIDLKNLKDE